MLEIIGSTDTPEYEAAAALGVAIKNAWPWIEADVFSWVTLIPNIQCHGQNPKDIDIVLLAKLNNSNASFNISESLTDFRGKPVEKGKVKVESLCLVIEVKDHGPEGIEFKGNKVYVRYGNRSEWHDATHQNEGQKYSLKNFLEYNGCSAPRISNLIWLRNLPNEHLPRLTNNILPSDFTWNRFLNTVARECKPRARNNEYSLASEHDSSGSVSMARNYLIHRISPTVLDRKKIESMCGLDTAEPWYEAIGKRQVVLRGRGGTGKTMMLLQAAHKKYLDGNRSLILTYNNALASDIKRLMALSGIKDDIATGTIKVQTVQSYFYGLFKLLGVGSDIEEDFLEKYPEYLNEAAESFKNGLLTDHDIGIVKRDHPEEHGWDFVLLDEAQDWPDLERDIIREVYPISRFVVADGLDQLVRRQHNCDWIEGLGRDRIEIASMTKSLRLKKNLAAFANMIAREMGLPGWKIEENPNMVGGTVVVVEGSYFKVPGLHEELCNRATSLGNKPIDFLACVPPSLVSRIDGRSHLAIQAEFERVFQPIWDGTDYMARKIYPTDLNHLRVVQYESCRGLEGWMAINLAFDDFYDTKVSAELPRAAGGDELEDEELLHARFAAAWAMIPLTRAIDTLVIEVRPQDSAVKSALKRIHGTGCSDFMEWYYSD